MPLNVTLPVDLSKDGRPNRTASTPADYHALIFQGYQVVDGPAVAEVAYEDLTPAQKAARTRAENKAKEEGDAVDTSTDAVDTDLGNQAGDANPDA